MKPRKVRKDKLIEALQARVAELERRVATLERQMALPPANPYPCPRPGLPGPDYPWHRDHWIHCGPLGGHRI